MLLTRAMIDDTIAQDHFLPADAKNHMTTNEFADLYGVAVLKSLSKDKAMLEFLFGNIGQNSQSLTYCLECQNSIISFFGTAKPGFATNKVLNYSRGSWNHYKTSITEADAIEKADKIRLSLIAVLEKVDSSTTAVDIQKLLEAEDLPTDNWLKKYFTILYPDKFMLMQNPDWTYRMFKPLGLVPTDNWFENAKQFSEKAGEFGQDGVTFYHIVRSCAIEQMKAELCAAGIDPDQLAAEGNLLVNTEDNWKNIKKHIKDPVLQSQYEDFLRKKYNWGGAKSAAGALPEVAVAAETVPVITYKNSYSEKLIRAGNIIFRGAPGTGKSYLAKEIAADIVSGGTIRVYDELSDEQKKQVGFVQFHPSYDYSDFVEGLRPRADDDGTLGFELRDGVFKAFVAQAIKEPDKKFVFIIDEINRGEISKILGELFYSIDPGYRGADGAVSTQYSNMHPDEKFYIPENVYIIGTMNDIDRSVDTFDFAMRRRFRFIEIKAEDRLEMLDELPEKDEAIHRMKALNAVIEKTEGLGRNYQIGAAYFRKLKDIEGFEALWSDYLEPLLQEYVNGMTNEAELMAEFQKAYEASGKDEGLSDGSAED